VEFREIDRRSVVQQVADQLRDAVVAAVMRSSELPTELELSNAMMVSRPTLREALRILETEGLVQRDRRTSALRADAGTAAMSRPLRSALDVLTRTERITMAEILDLRLTVEARAAERAAEVATAAEIAELDQALEALRQPGLTGQEWDERALAFHVAMVSASHNEAFVLIMVAAREAAAGILERALREAAAGGEEVTGRVNGADPTESEWLEGQYALHKEIYEAIRDRRPLDARDNLWRWSTSFPSFFQPSVGDVDGTPPGSPRSTTRDPVISTAKPQAPRPAAQGTRAR
jgi:GntR family transcriptional repressor for pyruvate dehydrogenase complex